MNLIRSATCAIAAFVSFAITGPSHAQDENAAEPPQDYSQIDWSEAVANLRNTSGPLFRIERAGDFGCELTYFDNGTDPDFVLYYLPAGGPSIFTIYAPEAMLYEPDNTQFSMVSVRFPDGGDRKLVYSLTGYNAVDDPNRGRVLRVQNGFSHKDLRDTGYFNFAKSTPEGEEADEDAPMLEFNFNVPDVNFAVDVFEGCLTWVARRPEFIEWTKEEGLSD